MIKITCSFVLLIAWAFAGQEMDKSVVEYEKSGIRKMRVQKPDTLNILEEEGVALLQERAMYQSMLVARQRMLIYALIFLTILLVGSSVLLIRSSRKKRLANDLLALKSLSTQMSPHFIFNALNSVNGFISNSDIRAANKYLSDFSRLMRTVMENLQKDFVPLAEEITALELYLSLEHFRFIDTFDYDLVIDETVDVDQHIIPPMLLQPYIENAIWHGLRYKKEFGHLSVKIGKNSTHLLLQVLDNGIGRDHSQKLKTVNQQNHMSTGMKNTQERVDTLSRIYKNDISVEIRDIENQSGTDILVKIPLSLTERLI